MHEQAQYNKTPSLKGNVLRHHPWRKPDALRPGIVGMRGVMVIRLGPCTGSSTSLVSSAPPPAVCKAHQPYRGFAHRYQQQPRYEERNGLMTVPVAVSATALGGGTGDGTGD